jgi:hypothetical protein
MFIPFYTTSSREYRGLRQVRLDCRGTMPALHGRGVVSVGITELAVAFIATQVSMALIQVALSSRLAPVVRTNSRRARQLVR